MEVSTERVTAKHIPVCYFRNRFNVRPLFMSANQQMDQPDGSNDSDENAAFNGAELSESVLAGDWNSPEEDDAWSNL